MILTLIFCQFVFYSTASIESNANNICGSLDGRTFPMNASFKLDPLTQERLGCKTYNSRFMLSINCLFHPVYDCSNDTEEGSSAYIAKKVRYLLWTRSNSNDFDYFAFDVKNKNFLLNSSFNGMIRTFFIIHGFQSNGKAEWVKKIKTNYLTISDCNVIAIDWKNIADNPNYAMAAQRLYKVADISAKLIDWMISSTNLTSKDIHITGHSLGAQMAGMIGKRVTKGKIDRITGLDPAGPLFHSKPSSKRISKGDAEFVDIIHSNGGSVLEGCYGDFAAVGDVDFYPNGGKHQPGCSVDNITNMVDIITVCSHGRSHDYWAESILAGQDDSHPNIFWAWQCETQNEYTKQSCPFVNHQQVMGFNTSRSIKGGTYYLSTNYVSPFAIGSQK